MVVDTSALVAIILGESIGGEMADTILMSEAVIAAPNFLEAHMVLAKFLGENTARVLDEQLRDLGVRIVPFGNEQLLAAYEAFERFGKGRHRAALNFGDCMAYATARVAGQPLLYVGQDFALTDIEPARKPA